MIDQKNLWQIKRRVLAKSELFLYKRRNIILNLSNSMVDDIIDQFLFENIRQKSPELCKLLNDNKSCHNISTEDLNCFNCICPFYQVEFIFDEHLNQYKLGLCQVNSEHANYKETRLTQSQPLSVLILNCTNCILPHKSDVTIEYIQKELNIINRSYK